MRKVLCCIMAVIMVVSCSTTALAENRLDAGDSSTACIALEGGHLFVLQTLVKNVAILTNDERHLIDISIKYTNEDVIYHWVIDDYSVARFDASSAYFWNGIIEYAELNMEEADTVTILTVLYDEPIDIADERSSAAADLAEDLEELVGQSEYSGRMISRTIMHEGMPFHVYESLQYQIVSEGYSQWNSSITVSSFILTVLNKSVNSVLLGVICRVFGVAENAYSVIPAGRINKYTCRAMYYRYVRISNWNYIYNISYRFVEYDGYEDNSPSSLARAYADPSSRFEEYVDGESYYNAFYSQVVDAYNTYLVIGQMN